MSNSHCQIVLLCPAIFGWFYVASCLSKLNSKRKNPPRVWNVQLFSPQQNKNSCCWIDEFSYVHILGGLRAFKVYDPWPLDQLYYPRQFGSMLGIQVVLFVLTVSIQLPLYRYKKTIVIIRFIVDIYNILLPTLSMKVCSATYLPYLFMRNVDFAQMKCVRVTWKSQEASKKARISGL